MGVEDPKHLLTGVRQEFLCIPRISNRFSLLSVAEVIIKITGQVKVKVVPHFNFMCRKVALGISRTKIHLTLKTPFHLSEAQTVLFLVWSTYNMINSDA
jgi:hypothetical protein